MRELRRNQPTFIHRLSMRLARVLLVSFYTTSNIGSVPGSHCVITNRIASHAFKRIFSHRHFLFLSLSTATAGSVPKGWRQRHPAMSPATTTSRCPYCWRVYIYTSPALPTGLIIFGLSLCSWIPASPFLFLTNFVTYTQSQHPLSNDDDGLDFSHHLF